VKFLLDTNIAIHALEGHEIVLERLDAHAGAVFLSALSLAELQRGLHRAAVDRSLLQARLRRMLASVPILPFDAFAAQAYGDILGQIGWSRRRDFDRMIGAHALSTECTLVTANFADFSDIPGLSIDNWAHDP
jgi:tRNA(fMet)-specific endonuclease VapC